MTAEAPSTLPASPDGSSNLWPWAVGIGAITLGLGYVAYRGARDVGAPLALGLYAPDLLPDYEAWRKGRTSEERHGAMMRMLGVVGSDDAKTQVWRRPEPTPAPANPTKAKRYGYEIVDSEGYVDPEIAGQALTPEGLVVEMQNIAQILANKRKKGGGTESVYRTWIRRWASGTDGRLRPTNETIKVFVRPGDTRRVNWLRDETSGEAFT